MHRIPQHTPQPITPTGLPPSPRTCSLSRERSGNLQRYPYRGLTMLGYTLPLALLLATGTAAADNHIAHNGSRWAELEDDGDVYISGRKVGEVQEDGDIYIDGRKAGEIEEDGDIYIHGRKVGEIEEDGDIYISGRKLGEIEEDGDIYVRGTKWGDVDNCCSSITEQRRIGVTVIFFTDIFGIPTLQTTPAPQNTPAPQGTPTPQGTQQ